MATYRGERVRILQGHPRFTFTILLRAGSALRVPGEVLSCINFDFECLESKVEEEEAI